MLFDGLSPIVCGVLGYIIAAIVIPEYPMD